MPKLEPVQVDIITKSDGKGVDEASKKLTGFGGTLQKIGTIAAGIGLANLGQQFLAFGKQYLASASEEAKNFEKAMITLDIVAGRFGESGQEAQQSAQSLAKELRIGVGSAAESLQNLLKSGLDLDTASELMKRFTNEAITGKSPTISLSQAVENLSFAYATNNSALGNLSGISENFSDIIKKGTEALIEEGYAAEEITEDMAKLKGMMDLTNLTLGSSERFTGTLIDKQAELDQKLQQLQVTIGQGLNIALSNMLGILLDSGLIDSVANMATNIGNLGTVIQPVTTFLEQHRQKLEAIAGIITIGLIPSMVKLAAQLVVNTALWVAQNVTALATAILNFVTLISNGYAMIAMFVAKGAVLVATTAYWVAYNTVTTLANLATGRLTISMIAQKASLIALNTWTALVTAAQWAWNIAMSANPIGLVIIGVAALVAGIVIAVGKWDEFKEKAVAAIKWVLDWVSKLVDKIKQLEIPGLGKVGDLIGKIPGLAVGVDNFEGGIARVGEQGPETVVLPKGASVQPYNSSGGGGQGITVNQYIQDSIDLDFAFRELAYVLRTS